MRVVVGNLTESGEEAVWLPNRTGLVNHFNVGITGTMGTGKTQLTKSLLVQLHKQRQHNPGSQAFGLTVFDYKGDYNDPSPEGFAAAVGAEVLAPELLPLNPLHLATPKSRQQLKLLAREFADTLRSIAPGIGEVQRGELIRGVETAMTEAGIDPGDPSSWTGPFPTLRELRDVLERDELAKGTPRTVINDLVELDVFAREDPTEDLDAFFDGVHVIDLVPLASSPSVIRAILAFFMNSFYARMVQAGEAHLETRSEPSGEQRSLRQVRRLVLVDEADDFIGLGLNSLKNVMQQGRSFGCGVFLSTQYLYHFNKTDPPLRQLIGTWVLHQMQDVDPKDYKLLFGFTPTRAREFGAAVSALGKHESLCYGLSNPGCRTRTTRVDDLPFYRL